MLVYNSVKPEQPPHKGEQGFQDGHVNQSGFPSRALSLPLEHLCVLFGGCGLHGISLTLPSEIDFEVVLLLFFFSDWSTQYVCQYYRNCLL